MPKYEISSPDGRKFEITAPEGATQEQVLAYAKSNFGSPTPKQEPVDLGTVGSTTEPPKVSMDDFPRYKEEKGHNFAPVTNSSTALLSTLAGLQGVLKPLGGALQFGGINKPTEAMDKNAEYAKSNVLNTNVGGLQLNPASAMETVGEIAPSLAIPETLGAKIPGLASAISKVPSLKYLVPSAVLGLGSQVTDTENKSYMDILGEKIADLGLSTGLGVAGGKLGQMAMNPQVSARLQQLKDMGMKTFTPGQLASQFPVIGEGLQKIEKGLTSLPIAGSVIGSGIKSSFEDFNKAIGNKVLSNLGLKLNKDAPVGNKMIEAIGNEISNAYDGFLGNTRFADAFNHKTGMNTSEHLSNLADSAMSKLVPGQQKSMANDIATNVTGHIQNEGVMSGEQYREIEKYLSSKANDFFSQGMDGLGHAYKTVLTGLRDELKRQNPTMAKQLENAHKAFREFQPLEIAASRRGADEGVFTPDQFKSAAEQVSGKKGTASGKGIMIPESQAGREVLGSTLPSSGTAERLLSAKGVMGGMAELPLQLKTLGAPLIASGLLYNQPTMRMLTKLATERPEAMKILEPTISKQLANIGAIKGTEPFRKE